MRHILFSLILAGTFFSSFSQSDSLKKKKTQWYYTWGYTRAMYSRSTIHFKNNSGPQYVTNAPIKNYDFTLYDVKAADQADFNKIPDVINITIPQWVFRIGYSFNEKWGIELNYDHTKYVVNDWQNARIKGQINGSYIDGDTIMNPNSFLHFEHTDGANFWMINAVRRFQLYKAAKNFTASYVVKPGAGIVFPRTDVNLFGQHLNNDWVVAGWIVGVETGLRMEFLKHGFMEFVGKGAFADYQKCLVLGRGNGTASHKIFAGQFTLTLGLRFDSKK
jgi:hypothetical protein